MLLFVPAAATARQELLALFAADAVGFAEAEGGFASDRRQFKEVEIGHLHQHRDHLLSEFVRKTGHDHWKQGSVSRYQCCITLQRDPFAGKDVAGLCLVFNEEE